MGYCAMGNAINGASSNSHYLRSTTPFIVLPIGFNNVNPAYTANYNPVFYSLPYCPYVESSLPADFGISFHYVNNTMNRGDKLIVTAGVEEWEILDRSNSGNINTGASSLFLARVV